MVMGLLKNAPTENNLKSSARGPQLDTYGPVLTKVTSESTCLLCPAQRESAEHTQPACQWRRLRAGLLAEALSKVPEAPAYLTASHTESPASPGALQQPEQLAAGGGEERGMGVAAGSKSPPPMDVSAIKSLMSSDGGTPGFAVAAHTCHGHFEHTAPHVGWRVAYQLKMYLFIIVRHWESDPGP